MSRAAHEQRARFVQEARRSWAIAKSSGVRSVFREGGIVTLVSLRNTQIASLTPSRLFPDLTKLTNKSKGGVGCFYCHQLKLTKSPETVWEIAVRLIYGSTS